MPVRPFPPSLSADLEVIAEWLATADRDALHTAVLRLTTRVRTLEWERTALTFAADSFGALADRLNSALRELHQTPPA